MNPVEEIIQKLKSKELIMAKGANMHPLVKLEDALEALEELEVKIWLMCEEEKNQQINKENY
jgi:hypothetical protein